MTSIFNLVSKTNIFHKNLILPVHLSSDQANALITCDIVIDEIVQASGTQRVSARSVVEAMARRDAEADLILLCEQFHELLQSNGLGVELSLYKVSSPNNAFESDVYWLPETGLEIEIFQANELDEAA